MVETASYYDLKILSDPFVQGDAVYFTSNWIERDEYRSSIFRYDGKNVERLTFGGREKSPRAIGNKLYYISYTKEEERLMLLENMKEPKRLFTAKSISKFIPHGEGMLIIARAKDDPERPFVTDRIKYRFDNQGFLRTRKRLILLTERPVVLVSGQFDVTDVASNGKRIVFSATMEDDDRGLADVFEYDLKNQSYDRITKGKGEVNNVCISENGEIAYIGHRKGVSPWGTMNLIFPDKELSVPIGNGAENTVNSDLFVPPSSSLIWDGGKFYLVGQVGGESFVYSYDGRSAKRLTGENRSVRAFHVGSGKLSYIYTSLETPSVLVFGEEYNPNPEVRGRLAEHLTIGGREAWIILSSKDNPTVLAVHGGPQTAYGYGYNIEFNFLADNGFNVLYGNPRGSSGYGEQFAKECVGDWGGKDFEDLLEFMGHSIEKYGIRDLFGITGGSYGGYMTNNAIVKTDRFKCAISERCVSNLMSMCGTSDIGFWFNAVESEVDDPWSESGIKKLLEFSPVTKAGNVKTPTMFIHGEEDYRCPIEQSEQMFTALRMNGVDSVLARYPGDSHEHARRGVPANMKDRLTRKLEWFRKYME